MTNMKYFLRFIAALLVLCGANTIPAMAQEALPQLPPPIQTLVDEGAQIRYLGKEHGLDSWLTIKNGQEQYFYVLPGGEAFLMGVMFDNTGKVVTVDQVKRLRAKGDPILDTLTSSAPAAIKAKAFEFKSPSEQLFFDIENSNWVPLGQPGTPVMYGFIDPQCPHCHAFINDLREKKLMAQGKVQLRMVPVGFREETKSQAAFLLAAPDPQGKWFQHMDGDKNALPARSEINTQGVQKNLAIMQSWKFNVTPMIVYRAKDGQVKIVRGRPKDINSLIADIGSRT